MNIGIDLDGVIFNTEEMFRACAELYDFSLGLSGPSCPKEMKINRRYSWSKEDFRDFYTKNLFTILEKAPLVPLAKEVVDALKKEGHEIFFVTSRSLPREKEITYQRLKEENLNYPVHFSTGDKFSTCKDLQIDVMIDDYYEYIDALSKAGIRCIQITPPPLKEVHRKNVTICRNWGEVYRAIQNFSQNKK